MNKFLKNKILFITVATIRTLASLCATGILIQLFLAELGFSEKQIYLHATLVQAVNVAATVFCSRYADGKRYFRRLMFPHIPLGVLYLFLLPFCFLKATPVTFVLLLAIALVQSFFQALLAVADYKLPYFSVPVSDYGVVQAISGVILALSTFGVGELLTYLKTLFPYQSLMTIAFPVAAGFTILSGILSLFYTALTKNEWSGVCEPNLPAEKESGEESKAPKITLMRLFREPVFYQLIPANFLRGFASGTTMVFATIALSLGFSTETAMRTVSLSAIANLCACFLIAVFSRYLSPRLFILTGSLCFLLISLFLFKNPALFLLAYTLVLFGKYVVDSAVPMLLLYAVDVRIAGPFNAWRMILVTSGSLVATSVAVFLPPTTLLFLSIGASLISGVLFFSLPLLRKISPIILHGRPHLAKPEKK